MTAVSSAPQVSTLGSLIGRLNFWRLRLMGRDRYDRTQIEWVDGSPLIILPTVFNPCALRTGRFFADQVQHLDLGGHVRVLDLGTGSGICAVSAAKRAAHVVAVDLNPAAVRCARINALLNHLEDRIDARHGDLFEPVGDECFDVILFNPPFCIGEPKDPRDYAWRSPDVVRRFADELADHLSEGGYALLLLSTFADSHAFRDLFEPSKYVVSVWSQTKFVNETIVIYRVERA